MIRRSIGFVLTIITLVVVQHHLEYNPELRDRVLENPWKSLGLLVLVILAVVAIIWAIFWPSRRHVVHIVQSSLAFGLGIAATLWINDLFGGIKWGEIGLLLGGFVALLVFWAITCGPDRWFRGMSRWVANHMPRPGNGDDADGAPGPRPVSTSQSA